MILLINTFITNESSTGGVWEKIGRGYNRGNLKSDNKLDILKYMISSLAVAYPWKKAIIKVELDESYSLNNEEEKLKEFICNEFSNTELIYSNKRNVVQQDWIDTYDLINDELIYHICSHDHIFLGSSQDYLISLVNEIKEKYKDNYLTLTLSHWPEVIRAAKSGYIDYHETFPSKHNENYKLEENFISYDGFCYDSIHIISKNLFKDWYLTGKWDDALKFYPPHTFKSNHLELPRIDGVGITDLNMVRNKLLNIPTLEQKIIVPYKELVRHFDGYNHVHITNNQCPAIEIPPGFFENDIKIRYGYDDYKEGWVNINPKNPNYYAYDKTGTDYKFTLEDLPLVWKNRISVVYSNDNIDEEEMIQNYLMSILRMIYTDDRYNTYIDKEVENKILEEYLKTYPQYQIND